MKYQIRKLAKMKYQIVIETKKSRQLTDKEAEEIINALNNLGYKSGELKPSHKE